MMLYRFVRLDETDLVPADAFATRILVEDGYVWIFRLPFNKAIFINFSTMLFHTTDVPETEQ